MSNCANCTKHSDCQDPTGCNFERRLCASCAFSSSQKAVMACFAEKPRPSVCLSTEWLLRSGLMHTISNSIHSGVSEVLCIPGLPCGTYGHLLRECTLNRVRCRLKTYREVCENRSDCVKSVKHVVSSHFRIPLNFDSHTLLSCPLKSRVIHNFDWSIYQLENRSSEGAVLELTSLSLNPDSSFLSLSGVIAFSADALIKKGFARHIDTFVNLQLRMGAIKNAVCFLRAIINGLS